MPEGPKVSLVMKVYNGEKYLRQAIDSILGQTFSDFEFLIIDDGSTDGSADIVKSYQDTRIRFLQNEKNMGLCKTQNKVIAEAKGQYIAVMDCDDISYPDRFEKQVAYLDSHPGVMMCGTLRNDIIGEKEVPLYQPILSLYESIRFSLYFGNYCYTHSSIMFRAEEYNKSGFSYGPVKIAEDYELIIKMADKYPIAVIPERLVAYRIYQNSTSKVKSQDMGDAVAYIKTKHLKSLQISAENEELLLSYFKTDIATQSLNKFLYALGEVAEKTNADISEQGDAYKFACELIMEYIIKRNVYDMSVWNELKQSSFHTILSQERGFAIKLLGACILHYKRK